MKPASRNQALLAELRKQRGKLAEPAESSALAPETPPPEVAGGSVGRPAESVEATPSPHSSLVARPAVSAGRDEVWVPALVRQTGPGRWTPGGLLAVLAASLSPDFPSIQYAGEEISVRGVYRFVSRRRGGTVVRVEHPAGTHVFAPVAGSAAFEGWRRHFSRQGSEDPKHDASRLCCAELVKNLESFDDYQRENWTKIIDAVAWQRVAAAE